MRRGPLVAGVTSAVCLLVLLHPAHGAEGGGPIRPGMGIRIVGGGDCTANWVYDGVGALRGRVFIGTAGHCVSRVGQDVYARESKNGPSGGHVGRVVFSVFDSRTLEKDYAFIEVPRTHWSRVRAEMKGHPGVPSGISTVSSARRGDTVQFSGYGTGFEQHQLTQEGRTGRLHVMTPEWHGVVGPVLWGDSGGPAADMTDGGKALGIVTFLGVGEHPEPSVGEFGPNLVWLLADAARSGFTVRLRLAG